MCGDVGIGYVMCVCAYMPMYIEWYARARVRAFGARVARTQTHNVYRVWRMKWQTSVCITPINMLCQLWPNALKSDKLQ